MIVRYGSFDFADNEALVSFFGQARSYNDRGRTQQLRKRMTIEGEIIGASTAAIDARVAQIKDAFAVEGGTAVLLTSAGVETQFKLDSSAYSGVRIVEGPSFFVQEGKAHYTTGLPFHITLEGDYLVNDGDGLISYSETITHVGDGGPRRVLVELDNGPAQEQIVSTNTNVTIVQSGEAVGMASYPDINAPTFPEAIDRPDGIQISRGSPRLEGLTHVDWPVRWSYRMSLNYLPGLPNPILR